MQMQSTKTPTVNIPENTNPELIECSKRIKSEWGQQIYEMYFSDENANCNFFKKHTKEAAFLVKICNTFNYKLRPHMEDFANRGNISYNKAMLNFLILCKTKIQNLEEYMCIDTNKLSDGLFKYNGTKPGDLALMKEQILKFFVDNFNIEGLIEEMDKYDELRLFDKQDESYKLNKQFILFTDEYIKENKPCVEITMYKKFKNKLFDDAFKKAFMFLFIDNLFSSSIYLMHLHWFDNNGKLTAHRFSIFSDSKEICHDNSIFEFYYPDYSIIFSQIYTIYQEGKTPNISEFIKVKIKNCETAKEGSCIEIWELINSLMSHTMQDTDATCCGPGKAIQFMEKYGIIDASYKEDTPDERNISYKEFIEKHWKIICIVILVFICLTYYIYTNYILTTTDNNELMEIKNDEE